MPWTAEQVALAERHARADIARVVTLGANTGQRGSDLIRMGPTDIETYDGRDGIKVIQKRAGREVLGSDPEHARGGGWQTWERLAGPVPAHALGCAVAAQNADIGMDLRARPQSRP